MKMSSILQFLTILALVMFAGCITTQVSSEYDSAADFSRLQTYAWVDDRPQISGETLTDNFQLNSFIRDEIERGLTDKGYNKQPQGPSDFFLRYHLAIEENVKISTLDYSSHDRTGLGSNSSTAPIQEYDRGTLLVEIIDPQTKRPLWRGTAQVELYRYTARIMKNQGVKKAIRAILDRFPSR